MSGDPVATNYNDKGTLIMERIYGEDFLSPGGTRTTESLVGLASLGDEMDVLDVGSGLGGAAFYLGARKRCCVQGIDLMEMNVAEANRRALAKGLSNRVGFMCADATALPFSEGRFDVVWGQDAWCHVEDKRQLIEEAYRVLTPGGLIVFSDWLLLDAHRDNTDELRQVTASPGIGDVNGYRDLLETTGFMLINHEDTIETYSSCYRDVLDRLTSMETEIVSRFGQKVYDIVLSKQAFVFNAFDSAHLGAGYFVAQKPA